MIPLNELVVYKTAMEIGETAWLLTEAWTPFQRDTLGKQIVRAADSIALNIAEGYGASRIGKTSSFAIIAEGRHLRHLVV